MSGVHDALGDGAEPILVTNQNELDAALAAATGGETIALTCGEYDGISLKSRDFSETVRIVSANEDEPATITGVVSLRSVSNLSIEGVDLIGASPLPLYASRIAISDCDNVSVVDMTLSGAIPTTGMDPDDPAATGKEQMIGVAHEYGVSIGGSTGVILDNLDITGFNKGVKLFGGSDTTITNSEFHDLRSDGIAFGSTSDILIEGNHFHDFSPWSRAAGPGVAATGDHPDFIQYMGHPGEGGIAGVVIRDNIMRQGDGGAVQAIFGHAVRPGMESEPFSDFEVSGNFIQISHVHGIALGDVVGAQVFGNVLIPAGQDYHGDENGWRPGIWLSSRGFDAVSANIDIFDNIMTLGWKPEFDPTGWGAEINGESNISYADNTVLEQGRAVSDHWSTLEFPDPSGFPDAASWIDAVLRVLGAPPAEETPEDVDAATDALIVGTEADDVLVGGDGDDTLDGGGGDDMLTGGAGADLFIVADGQAGDRTRLLDLDFLAGDTIAFARDAADQSSSDKVVVGDIDELFAYASSDGARLGIVGESDMRLLIDRSDGEQIIDITLGGKERTSADLSGLLAGDAAKVASGETVMVDVLANDDADENAFLSGHGESMLGSRVEIVDGQIRYSAAELPDGLRVAIDTITYAVADGAGGVGFGQMKITLSDVGPPTHQGGAGDDVIATPHGDDVIHGGAGDDTLYSRRGDDWLDGGAGDDVLTGCEGSDTLNGGDGADKFVFYGSHGEGRDLIVDLDFTEGDRLVFGGFDEDTFGAGLGFRSATGAGAGALSVEHLLALENSTGVSLSRLDDAHLLLRMELAGDATGEIEIMLDGASATEFESLWLAA